IISAGKARHRSRRPSKSIPMLPFGTLIQGKYELQQVLGAGGYGQIFKAYDSNKNLHVAIKIMQKKHEPQRMILEQQILFALKGHPEFPQLYGSGSFDDYMFIVMELLGKSLSELRKKNEGKKFDAITALRVGLLMTETLRVLHDMGYLHRNMAFTNNARSIIVKEKGIVKRRGHVGFRGTLRYVSLNVHERKDQISKDEYGLDQCSTTADELGENVNNCTHEEKLKLPNFCDMGKVLDSISVQEKFRAQKWSPTVRKRQDMAPQTYNLLVFSGMSTELQEYYTYCYDNVEDPNQPSYDFLKSVINKCFPAGFDFNTPMPWELKGPSVDITVGLVSQEGEYAENEPQK
ncbi:hypothetical protein TELCIR_08581, partial [Teladorsagia circumcincta]